MCSHWLPQRVCNHMVWCSGKEMFLKSIIIEAKFLNWLSNFVVWDYIPWVYRFVAQRLTMHVMKISSCEVSSAKQQTTTGKHVRHLSSPQWLCGAVVVETYTTLQWCRTLGYCHHSFEFLFCIKCRSMKPWWLCNLVIWGHSPLDHSVSSLLSPPQYEYLLQLSSVWCWCENGIPMQLWILWPGRLSSIHRTWVTPSCACPVQTKDVSSLP